MSLVSLIQHAFAVGMSPLLTEVLQFYRALTYPVFDFALSWLPFRFASSVKDLFLIIFLIWGIQMRHFWCLPKSEIRSFLLKFYAVYKLVFIGAALFIIYVPSKLTFGINVLSLGLEALHPNLLAILLVGLLLAPIVGFWLGGRRAARNPNIRDTERGREIAYHSREALISYVSSLAIIVAVAGAVFAFNFQAP